MESELDILRRQVSKLEAQIGKHEKVEILLRQTADQLACQSQALEKTNIALQEVLDHIQSEKDALKLQLTTNIEDTILPAVRRLIATCPPSMVERLEVLENDFRRIASPFLHSLKTIFTNLSPRELELCLLIQSGLASKEIASVLGTSEQTVFSQRKAIRRKLRITNSATNLTTFLRSVDAESSSE